MSRELALTKFSGEGYTFTLTPEGQSHKDTLLAETRGVLAVTDPESCELAQSSVRKLGIVRIAVEKERKAAKEPVLALGKKIDATAEDFVAEVVAEEKRIKAIVDAYAAEQVEKARRAREEAERIERAKAEEERRKFAEEQRLERERLQAEINRQRAENERLLAEKRNDEEAINAARQREEQARLEKDRADRAAAQAEEERKRNAELLQAEPPKPATGLPKVELPKGTRTVVDYEVTNIHEFYHQYPHLCNVTIKREELLGSLKKLKDKVGDKPMPDIPGLRVIIEIKAGR